MNEQFFHRGSDGTKSSSGFLTGVEAIVKQLPKIHWNEIIDPDPLRREKWRRGDPEVTLTSILIHFVATF
jgi:hypothetical protein